MKKNDDEKKYSLELVKMDFTDNEKIELGLKVAGQVRRLKSIERQKKSAVADFKASEEAANLEIDELTRKIDDGFEMRREECEVQHDNKLKMVHFVLEVGGVPVIVKQRKMSPDEIQLGIPGVK